MFVLILIYLMFFQIIDIIKQLREEFTKKGIEMNEFATKNRIQLKGDDDNSDSREKPKQSAGVLV